MTLFTDGRKWGGLLTLILTLAFQGISDTAAAQVEDTTRIMAAATRFVVDSALGGVERIALERRLPGLVPTQPRTAVRERLESLGAVLELPLASDREGLRCAAVRPGESQRNRCRLEGVDALITVHVPERTDSTMQVTVDWVRAYRRQDGSETVEFETWVLEMVGGADGQWRVVRIAESFIS